jgi:hypothetical protein
MARLDRTLANQIQLVAGFRVNGTNIVSFEGKEFNSALFELEAHGLIYHGAMGLRFHLELDSKGKALLTLSGTDECVLIEGAPAQEFEVPIIGISRAMIEILSLVDAPTAPGAPLALARQLYAGGASKVLLGRIVERRGGALVAESLSEIARS